MPLGGNHPMHPFVIDAKGQIFVDMGTATNACQSEAGDRNAGRPSPCTELETRGGTWKYDANKLGQTFSPKERFATGIRNGEGFAFEPPAACSSPSTAATSCRLVAQALSGPKHATELPSEELSC